MKMKLFLLTILLAKTLAMTIPQIDEGDRPVNITIHLNRSSCSDLRSKGKCSVDCPCTGAGECCSKYGYCGTTSQYCDNPMSGTTSNKTTTTKKSTTTTKKSTTTTKKSTTTTKKSTTTTKKSTSTSAGSAGVVAYLPNYQFNNNIDILTYDFSNVDVIIYCFFRISDSGEAYSYYDSIDFKKKNIYYLNNDVKKKYPKLRTVISFGGSSGSKNFGSVLSSEEKIKTAAKSVANIMNTYGFDGIDIDWEFPSDETQCQNFATFLKKIRSYIGTDKILTISAAAFADKYKGYVKKYNEYVNWFNIMSYIYAGSWNKYSGHNSPLYNPTNDLNHQKSCDTSVSTYLSEGVSASKLVLGASFSGQAWLVQSSANNGYNQKGSTKTSGEPGNSEGIWSYRALREQKVLLSRRSTSQPWIRTWHSDAKSPTLFNPKTYQYISYDDIDSMCERISYVKKKGLAGFMMWEIGQDYKRELLTSVTTCYYS